MPIKFKFDPEKAVGAMAYLVDRLGSVDKVKLMKLVYIADRNHFLRYGYPITGATQKAMPYGPVPSECLDLLEGRYFPFMDSVYKYLHLNDSKVTLGESAGDELEPAELETLDKVLQGYGATPKWALVGHTHQFEEYEKARQGANNKAPLISYESLLETYPSRDPRKFWKGRPVISEAMAAKMICPFMDSGTDL